MLSVNKPLDSSVITQELLRQDGETEITKRTNQSIDIDIVHEGFTSLMMTAQNGHFSAMQLLLSSKASINAKSGSGFSSLFLAAMFGHKECVKLLLDEGADINSTDNEGHTALAIAAAKGYLEVVELLLSRNAKLDTQTKEGKTALYLASCKGYGDIQKQIMVAIKIDEKMSYHDVNNDDRLEMDESSYEWELKRLNLPVNWVLFDAYHVWQTRVANQSDSELVSSSLGSHRISYDYFQKIVSDYSYTIDSIDHSGCEIDKTENRGITIRQLQLVMNEIRKRCNLMKDKWKKYDANNNPTNETITPENANLYDINEPIIKRLTEEKKSSFVERVAKGDQQP
eukprot:gene7464-10175_t